MTSSPQPQDAARQPTAARSAIELLPPSPTEPKQAARQYFARRGLLGTTVSVIIPTLNEAENIGWVLDQIPSWVSEVLIVDGLSTDDTVEIARRHRPDIIVVEERRRGKGAALRAGFAAARSDIIVMIDADGSTNPREMIRFVYALLAGADFVKGSRDMRGGGSVDITRLRDLGNRFFTSLVNLLHNGGFTDLCYGYCAFWRRHLPALALTADGFEIETELIMHAARAGLEIVEVPSLELERRAGTSNLSAWRDGLRVLRTIITRYLGIFTAGQESSLGQGDNPQPGPAVGLAAPEALLSVAADCAGSLKTAGQQRQSPSERA